MSDIGNGHTGTAGGRAPDTGQARDAASRELGSAREETARAAETARVEAGRLAEGAKRKAYEAAESGREQAAGGLEDFTAAIRKASDELGERDQSMAAQMVREAASGLERATGAIRGSNVNELMRSTGDFARRQPGTFLLGAALAGVALGRFLRASSDHADGERLRETTGGGGRGTGSIPADGVNHSEAEAPLTRAGSTAFERGATSPAGVPREPQPASFGGGGAGGSGLGTGRDAPSPGLTPSPAFGTAGTSGTTGTSGLHDTDKKDETR